MIDATQLQSALDLAVERFMEECYLESNGLLLELVGAGLEDSFIGFCIGRNFLYMRDFASARSWFERSAEAESPFSWTFYELMRMFREVGDTEQAERCLTRFLSFDEHPDFNDEHRRELLKVAHECFLYDRRRAADLYELIARAGIRDYLCELRIAERLVDQQRFDEADERLQALRNWRDLDGWGLFAVARARHGQGLVDEAVSLILCAVEAQSDNASLKVIGIHKLIDFRATEAARRLLHDVLLPLAEANSVLAQEAANVEFRLAVQERAHARVTEMCRIPQFLERAPEWLPLEALFALAHPERDGLPFTVEAGIALADFLERHDRLTLGAVLAQHQFHVRRRDWSRVGDLHERIRNNPLYDEPEIVLRRFEVLCLTSRLREAEDLYRRYYAQRSLQQSESIAVMRFLAEVKLLDEAGKVLLEFFERGYDLPDGEHFLVQLCRKTGLHAEIICRLNAVGGPDAQSRYGRLRQLLIDDAVVKELASDFGAAEPATLSVRNAVLRKPPRRGVPKRRMAGILCCNRAYFLSHLTFLASYAARNPDAGRIDWYAVYDSDVPERWHRIATRFAAKLSLDLTTLKEKKILDCGLTRIEAYGIFTGGNTLSRSAFLRIYAARYLRGLGRYDRAVYIDSDIVCLRDISLLWTMPFDGQLLMARAEDLSADIRAAAARNDLEPARYFNSGVLAFDLSDPAIDERLDAAINLAENEQGRLVFHDQCALNIAFDGCVRYLEPEFNHYLRPHRADNGDMRDARLIHFLDRPKPWDVCYDRNYREHWERQAEFVRALLTPGEYNQLAAAANR